MSTGTFLTGKTFEGFKTEVMGNLTDSINEQEQRIANNSDLIGMVKDEMETNLAESITIQEQRIANNSDLIGTVKGEVETNEAHIKGFEVKIAEQDRRTARMLGGVFSDLSGVLAREVSEGVRTIEARETEQDEERKEIEEKNKE